jgi:hypothetical protein
MPAPSQSWGSRGGVVMATATPGSSFPVYSGVQGVEAFRFTKWVFTIGPTVGSTAAPVNYRVTLFGTIDPAVKITQSLTVTGGVPAYLPIGTPNTNYPSPVVAGGTGGAWFILPGEAAQNGTGTEVNPILNTQTSLSYDRELTACCCVIESLGSPTGNITVYGMATP